MKPQPLTRRRFLAAAGAGSALAARPLNAAERKALIEADVDNHSKYTTTEDIESAYERLQVRNSPLGQIKDAADKMKKKFGGLLGLNN